eukprot:SAG22_NODE_282_length_13050_cov_37.625125_6_plen_322_part_00
MAGLLRPQHAKPLMDAIKSVTDLPIHYHGHNTSSANLATILALAANGCDVVDGCMASMADCTSQPSINAFLASVSGTPHDTMMPFFGLENLDRYWWDRRAFQLPASPPSRPLLVFLCLSLRFHFPHTECCLLPVFRGLIRELYEPLESGMRSGTARVFDNQIPGGQYSNLFVQCKAMDLYSRWFEVLDMYRDVNYLLGDVVKVTPSSKTVGDFALFLIAKGLTTQDVIDRGETIDYPDSVVALFNGDLGYPAAGFPAWLSEKVLRGAVPKRRQGHEEEDKLPALDFSAKTAEVKAMLGRDPSEEDVMTAILYPKVYSDCKC